MNTTRRSFFTRLAGWTAALGLGVKSAKADTSSTVKLYGQSVPMEKAARWCVQFSLNQWPEDFPVASPHRAWSHAGPAVFAREKHAETWREVARVVPRKEQFRHWNVVECGQSPEAFEAWWAKECA